MIVQATNVCNCVHALCGVKTEYGSFLLIKSGVSANVPVLCAGRDFVDLTETLFVHK